MKYLLLDVPAYEAEKLAGSENLAAFLMRMERAPLPDDLLEEVRRMRKSFGAKNAELHRDFSIFISKVLLPRKTERPALTAECRKRKAYLTSVT